LNGAVTCRLTGKSYTIMDALLEMKLEGFGAVWLKIA